MRLPFLSSVNPRIATVAVHDVLMATIAFELALQVRYLFTEVQPIGFLWPGTLVFAAVSAVVFWRVGLYRGVWHYASLNDLIAILRASTFTVAAFLPVLFVFNRLEAVPRSSLPILWVLLIVLLTVPRFLYRALKDGNLRVAFERGDPQAVTVLVAGSDDTAEAFIRETARSRVMPYRVAGIVADSPGRIGRDIRGVRVLGELDDLADVVGDFKRRRKPRPQRLILAAERMDGATVRGLIETADRLGMTVARVPNMTDFNGGQLEVRKVDVEDLLGRAQVVLDRDAMRRLIAGRSVLVTGAGGTIGSELARQIARFGPAKLVLLDNGEFNLYSVDLDVGERCPDVPRVSVLGDVRDAARLEQVLQKQRPDLVFHAAAFKHVPLSEMNPEEAVLTNSIGTRNLAEACQALGVEALVLISTDKAVNAGNVMGATKRVAELVCQAMNRSGGSTRFVTVRFGNVLGSTGSVIPLFERQLRAGGPLTVTHPDVTRYFMTVREAVELVLQASAIPAPEAGTDSLFVLDMGDPVRIQDLAAQMIRLSGGRPGEDIGIRFVGLRPGEKLHEELFHAEEDLRPSGREGIRIGSIRTMDYQLLCLRLDRLEQAAKAHHADEVVAVLAELVPEARLQFLPDGGAAERAV